MNRVRFLQKIALAASFVLAMASTFSCSTNDDDDEKNNNRNSNANAWCVDHENQECINHPEVLASQAACAEWLGVFANSCPAGYQRYDYNNPGSNTYYIEVAAVSVYAWNYWESHPGTTADQIISILRQYPVVPDEYREVYSNVSRSYLEDFLDVDVPGYSREQLLHMIDQTGAAIQFFEMQNGDYIYIYVERV